MKKIKKKDRKQMETEMFSLYRIIMEILNQLLTETRIQKQEKTNMLMDKVNN